MWWNLNILRDTLKGSGQSDLILLSPAGRSRAYSSLFLRFHYPCVPTGLHESFRKELSMKPPQYNGDPWGLQKRDYLAKRETQISKELCAMFGE